MSEFELAAFTREALEASDFVGFIPFADLPSARIPSSGGVYVVLRPAASPPLFLDISPAGSHKGRSPTVEVGDLEAKWIPDALVVYIGKATSLHERLHAYRRQGKGSQAGHFGGRYIWQLADSDGLIVAWRETRGIPKDVEDDMLRTFRCLHSRLPFANLPPGGAKPEHAR